MHYFLETFGKFHTIIKFRFTETSETRTVRELRCLKADTQRVKDSCYTVEIVGSDTKATGGESLCKIAKKRTE